MVRKGQIVRWLAFVWLVLRLTGASTAAFAAGTPWSPPDLESAAPLFSVPGPAGASSWLFSPQACIPGGAGTADPPLSGPFWRQHRRHPATGRLPLVYRAPVPRPTVDGCPPAVRDVALAPGTQIVNLRTASGVRRPTVTVRIDEHTSVAITFNAPKSAAGACVSTPLTADMLSNAGDGTSASLFGDAFLTALTDPSTPEIGGDAISIDGIETSTPEAVAQKATIWEPSSIALLGSGLFGLGYFARRR